MQELYLFLQKNRLEAGCDEAGRGCLVGPVTAAAVLLPEAFENILLNDSKQLSEKNREKLKPKPNLISVVCLSRNRINR